LRLRAAFDFSVGCLTSLERRIAHQGSNGDRLVGARDVGRFDFRVKDIPQDSRDVGFPACPTADEIFCGRIQFTFKGTLPPKTSFIGHQYRIGNTVSAAGLRK
jgi:hypothetical protein